MVQNQIKEDICEDLCFLTGKKSLYKLSYKNLYIGYEKENSLFLKTRTKCCPICLEEQIHQSFTWGLNLINVCTKHNVYLLSKCKRCNKCWTIISLFKNRCSGCGHSLSKLQAEKVTDDLIMESQRALTEFLLGKRNSFLGLFKINEVLIVLSGFAQLFHGIHSITQVNAPKYKMEYTNKISFNQEGLVHLLADLYWVFKDFDHRFPLILQATFQQEATRETRRRRKNFENIITSSSNLEFIFNAYKNFRLEHYIHEMNVPKNIKSFDNHAAVFIEKNYLTMMQVKKQFGIVDSELAYLMSKSSFKECFFNNGRATYFKKHKTEEFLQEYFKGKSDKVTALEAATILGINVDRVFDFIKDGLLEYSPYLEDGRTLSKKQINQFLNSLNAIKINEVRNKIALARCFEKYNTSGLSLLQLISFIRTNGLFAYTQNVPYKLCDLFFEPTDLANKLKKHRIFTNGYNLNQVSQELKCSERTVLKYVNAGLLGKPIVEKINNRAFVYRFEIKVIEDFKETFCSVEEIVKEYNVSESLVRNALYRGVIKNQLSGICRKTLVNKWEFENYQKRGKDQ